jgi:hypothetical protein
LLERSWAFAVEEVAVLWAAAWGVFRAAAANAAGAENRDAKARRAVMGAFERILKNLGGADRQSISYAIGSPLRM